MSDKYWPRLLACPFCGARARVHPVGNKGYWRVSCDAALTCGHSGPALPALETAAESWNRRVAVAPDEVAEPPIYWRCFHCDFIARDRSAALTHFGPGISERSAICLESSETSISTDHGPWKDSSIYPGERYCERCLAMDKFAGSVSCKPHLVQVTKETRT